MRPAATHRLTAGLILIVMGCAPLRATQNAETDKTKTLLAARDKYYNLKKAGLVEVQARIQPNWHVVLAGTATNSGARTLLNGLHFSFSIDAEGRFKLDYRADVAPRTQNSADGVEKIFKDMNQSVSSFFGTWSIFLLTSPFPQVGSDYKIAKQANGYSFVQRQGELDVVVDTDNDFEIKEIRVSAPELTASLKPVFEQTPTGLLLKGYAANSQRRSGMRDTRLQASLEYEKVSGLQLLHRVSLDTVFEGAPAKIEWLFTDYQVRVR